MISSHSSDIPGFNLIHNHRVGRSGGGVSPYLAGYLEFNTVLTWYFLKIVLNSQ